VVAGLVMLMNISPSWGQPVCATPGCNPTTSDTFGNSAGGSGALHSVTSPGSGLCGADILGCQDTAFGKNALFNNTTGFVNTAIGYRALYSNTTGSSNTASGVFALDQNTLGIGNTASGAYALTSNSTGNDNTASGSGALEFNLTGNNNTATGANALVSNTEGSGNTSAGALALQFNVTGSNNTAIGLKALKKSLGTKNIGIGYQAGVMLTSGSNNIYIGNQGGANIESQTIRIGTAQAQTFIAGIGNAPVSGAIVMVDSGTGQLGIGPPSSARYKQDIETMGSRSAGMLQLRPVTFTYRGETSGTAHYGLVAEEVAAVYPELVIRSATGEVQTVKYHELIPMLLNELQHEHQEVATLKLELAELRALVGSRLEK